MQQFLFLKNCRQLLNRISARKKCHIVSRDDAYGRVNFNDFLLIENYFMWLFLCLEAPSFRSSCLPHKRYLTTKLILTGLISGQQCLVPLHTITKFIYGIDCWITSTVSWVKHNIKIKAFYIVIVTIKFM